MKYHEMFVSNMNDKVNCFLHFVVKKNVYAIDEIDQIFSKNFKNCVNQFIVFVSN